MYNDYYTLHGSVRHTTGQCQFSPAIFQDLEDIVPECIPVLLEESINVVVHLSSVVSDAKLRIVYFRFHIVRIILCRRQMFFDTTLILSHVCVHTRTVHTYIHTYIHMCKCAGIMWDLVISVKFFQQALVGAFWETALLVHQIQHTQFL